MRGDLCLYLRGILQPRRGAGAFYLFCGSLPSQSQRSWDVVGCRNEQYVCLDEEIKQKLMLIESYRLLGVCFIDIATSHSRSFLAGWYLWLLCWLECGCFLPNPFLPPRD